jgi:hypothetical protein
MLFIYMHDVCKNEYAVEGGLIAVNNPFYGIQIPLSKKKENRG